MSIAYNATTGKVVLYCHAGCQPEAILDACALTWDDLFDHDRADWSRVDYRGQKSSQPPSRLPKAIEISPPNGGSTASTTSSSSSSVQVPINIGVSRPPTPDVEQLLKRLQDVKSGRVEPDWTVPLRADRLASNAGSQRAGLENVAILMALWMEDSGPRDVSISQSLYARAMGWDDPDGSDGRRARRHLLEFEERGILHCIGELPLRGWPRGTKLWQPADYTLEDLYNGQKTLMELSRS